MAAQTALLRFLDSGEVRPVGGRAGAPVDVQIVSATNRPLAELVEARQFRQDLLHRLNAFTIELPPLRTRTDFAQIVRRLVEELAPDAAITDAAIEKLATLPWPGNIRELRNALQRALVRRRMAFIDEDSFDESLGSQSNRVCPACRSSPLDRRFCKEIEATHRLCSGNVTAAARKLGLSRTTVYKHLQR